MPKYLEEMAKHVREDVMCDWDADRGHYIARAKSDNRIIGVVVLSKEDPANADAATFIPDASLAR